jgi:SpoVK/Ycf46/Vps4 family AAA+-type ATPase
MSRSDSVTAGLEIDQQPALAWLDCLIEREILRLRARYELSLDELRGIYISDQQVDALLSTRLANGNGDPAAELGAQARALAPRIEPDGPLARLGARLGIEDAQLDIILLALAPELDLRYEALYAYLNNDVARKHLTTDLALRLLSGARAGAPAQRRWFARCAPLTASGALEWLDDATPRSSLQQGFVLTPLVAQALTGQPLADPRWAPNLHWLTPETAAHVSAATREALMQASNVRVALLVGDDSCDRIAAALHWAHMHDRASLRVPVSALAAERDMLACAQIVIDDDSPADAGHIERAAHARPLAQALIDAPAPVAIATSALGTWAQRLADLPYVRVELALPDVEERRRLWQSALLASQGPLKPAEASRAADACSLLARALARRFAIGPARIAAVVASLMPPERDAMPTPGEHPADTDCLARAGQLAAQAGLRADEALGRLATRVVRQHDWSRIVLPDNTLRQLHEIADAIGQRERVYHDWRMLERTGQSAGLAILFTGSSGTGKTMAASVVANAAGLDLYRIDLASVVSKYIGETEQNLDRIFSAAHGSNAILLFDEADALMGKRSEVKDAHDRYANLEVAYLLQKLEEHDGVAILASNLPKNLDSAFTRRIHYTLEFGRPNALLRERLWRGMFGPAVPLADDIDWRFLAEKFETTGGEIQAIALDAAFLAAARDEPVSMPHLMHAMARRQTKQGNPGGLARFEAHRASMNQSQASGFDA